MKLIFWINIFMTHFGLAYYLQKKLNGDFYAIIDTPNKPKTMFLNQKLVNFKKTWYFHDHVKKQDQNPDLEYLVNFEKKYHIDLWKLALNERHFYKFNRFYKFEKNEILKFLEQECKLFEKILDEINPDYFLTYDPPFHHQKLFHEMCKVRGVKVLCLYISKLEDKSIISDNGYTFNLPKNLDSIELDVTEKTEDKLEDSQYNILTKKWIKQRNHTPTDKLKAIKDYLISSDSMNTQTNFTYYGREKSKVLLETMKFYLRRKWRSRYLEKNAEKNVELNFPYVYYPLALDDESSLLNYAPFYTNQVEVIRHIAKSLPIDYRLYVKEHIHAVFRAWKEIEQYEQIKEIPNVTFIHPSVDSMTLVKNSKLVITIRGTASLDALYQNVPTIVFDDMQFGMIPSVYKVEKIQDLPKLVRSALSNEINPIYIKKYDKLMKEETIDFNWWNYEKVRNHYLYSGNILSDVEYPEKKVKQFFDDNEKIFLNLTEGYLEKINL